ncbi:MAG TPA: hypothetical protein VGM30_24850 [Puia sp.]|jgi:hypothetical protein
MKKFNKIITMEVSVDRVAEKLLKSIDPSSPHAELIAETTIGILVERGGIGYLLDSLNGWKEEIDIKEGTIYLINGKHLELHGFDTDKNMEENKLTRESLFEVEALQVSEFRDNKDKILVSYSYWMANRSLPQKSTAWVNHMDLKALQTVAAL